MLYGKTGKIQLTRVTGTLWFTARLSGGWRRLVVIRVAHTSPNAKTGPSVIKAACGRLLLDAYPHTSRHDTKMGQPIMP